MRRRGALRVASDAAQPAREATSTVRAAERERARKRMRERGRRARTAVDEIDRELRVDGFGVRRRRQPAGNARRRDVRVGFQDSTLAALEIVDSFGQRSILRFESFQANGAIAPETFRFTPPAAADVIEQ
jgi:hypothetical protein